MLGRILARPLRSLMGVEWNLSIADIFGTAEIVLISEVSSFQG